jgi:hypothetical protein
MPPESSALSAYEMREDLSAYGSNGLLLFAVQLRLGIEDIESLAATSLTDGPNDKKCDLVFVDRGASRIVVAQSYQSATGTQSEAPANKASDLNTAVTWLIAGDLTLVPENLRSAAEEVRDALGSGDVTDFEIWYVHNLPESANVRHELTQAATTADSLIRRHFPNAAVNCAAIEVGQGQLQEAYRRTDAPIALDEVFDLDVAGGFEVTSEGWSAYVTSVPATWLRQLWKQHAEDVMSPNVRDYLGIVKSERNINNGIQSTAAETPGQFWIYNNGLTVLVNSYAFAPASSGEGIHLRLTGLGIVNGAQTTGSIGTLPDDYTAKLDDASVLTRFVSCHDLETLGNIVRYNNTQNKIEAADFRSKDAVQDRLRGEFELIPDADYKGARRGGVRSAIERSRNMLPDSAVAQSLAAFHLEPNLAYNDTRRIWVDDGTYSDYFSDRTTARHIVFTFSCLRAVEAAKKRAADIDEGSRTEAQQRQVSFFRHRGSTLLLVAAVSAAIEAFLGRAVPDRWRLQYSDNCSPSDAQTRWQPIIDTALAFAGQLAEATDLGLKNPETVARVLGTVEALLEATADANRSVYESFAANVSS